LRGEISSVLTSMLAVEYVVSTRWMGLFAACAP
jgi:hypothetical protein